MSQLLSDVMVVRQPLVDPSRRVVAYELLYRDEVGLPPSTEAAGERATAQVLLDGLIGAGTVLVPRSMDAYVNVPAGLLLSGNLLDLPSEGVVLEVLEGTEDTPQLRTAIELHRAAGFRIALDDVEPDDPRLALVPHVDVAKVDMVASGIQPGLSLIYQLALTGMTVVAEKVEDATTFARSMSAGATFAQGFHFAHPENVGVTRPRGLDATQLELLDMLTSVDVDLVRVEQLIRGDVTLADRFLRLVRATVGGRPVKTVRDGLIMLGQRAVHRWIMLLVLSAMIRESTSEALVLACVRARHCERLEEMSGGSSRLDAFSTGMFSIFGERGVLPDDLLDELPVTAETRAALAGRPGALRDLLEVVLAAETARWEAMSDQARLMGLAESSLAAAHLDAVTWAEPLRALGQGAAPW